MCPPEAAVRQHINQYVHRMRLRAQQRRLSAVFSRPCQAALLQHRDHLRVNQPAGRRRAADDGQLLGNLSGCSSCGAVTRTPRFQQANTRTSLDDVGEQLVVALAVGVEAEDKALARHAHQVACQRQVPAQKMDNN